MSSLRPTTTSVHDTSDNEVPSKRFRSGSTRGNRRGVNTVRIAALLRELAEEFDATGSDDAASARGSATPIAHRAGRRPRQLVRPPDEATPEHIRALAARSLKERGFR
jgi:hypothetical protein